MLGIVLREPAPHTLTAQGSAPQNLHPDRASPRSRRGSQHGQGCCEWGQGLSGMSILHCPAAPRALQHPKALGGDTGSTRYLQHPKALCGDTGSTPHPAAPRRTPSLCSPPVPVPTPPLSPPLLLPLPPPPPGGGTRGLATATGFVSGASPHSNRGRTSRKLHHGGPAPPAGTGGSPHRHRAAALPAPNGRVLPPRGSPFPTPGVPVSYPGPVSPRTSGGRVSPPVLPVPPAEGPSRGHRPLLTRRGSGLARTPARDRRYRLLRGIIKRILSSSRGPSPAGSPRSPTGSAFKGLRGGASADFLSVRQHCFRFPFLSLSDECTRLQKVQPRAKKQTNRKNSAPAASVLRGYLQWAQCRAAAPTPWVTRTRTLGCRDVPSHKHRQMMLSTWRAPQPPQQLSAAPAQLRVSILPLHILVLLYIEGAVHRELC